MTNWLGLITFIALLTPQRAFPYTIMYHIKLVIPITYSCSLYTFPHHWLHSSCFPKFHHVPASSNCAQPHIAARSHAELPTVFPAAPGSCVPRTAAVASRSAAVPRRSGLRWSRTAWPLVVAQRAHGLFPGLGMKMGQKYS